MHSDAHPCFLPLVLIQSGNVCWSPEIEMSKCLGTIAYDKAVQDYEIL